MANSPARKRQDDEAAPPVESGNVAIDNRAQHIKVFWYTENRDGTYQAGGGSSGKMQRILPGLNLFVRRVIWEEMIQNPTWKAWVDKEQLVEVKRPPSKWGHADAMGLIDRSADIPSIVRWRKGERRGEVKKALDKKLRDMRRIAVAPTESDEDDDGIDV